MSAQSTIDTDVLVVGGGPAGTAAAITLARAGRTVLVVDKALFPRDKCCGDGLTTLALRELEPLGFEPAMVPNWRSVESTVLRSPSGREVCLPMPAGGQFAATAPRREFDTALVDLAVKAGADVRQGCAITGIRAFADRVEADVAELGTVSAKFVIAADGMWSPTRKLLGIPGDGYLGEWHAFRQYARNVTGAAESRLYVWFEPDLLPGYAWSFPLPDGRVNVGYGVVREGDRPDGRKGKDLKDLWADLWQRPHIAAALGPDVEFEDRATAWPIPAAVDESVLAAGRVLFVGDAARATDVMTGEGIGQALLTGRLAAEAIVGRAADDVASRYRTAVRHELFADHRTSKVLNRLLARPLLARGAVRVVGLNGFTRRNFVRWMFEDEPRAIALTPRRWHRRFLRRPAPYR